MKPPPPRLPANGCVTASAKAVVTAASTALPPLLRIAAPRSEASSDDDTTSPAFDVTVAAGAIVGDDWEPSPAGMNATSSGIASRSVSGRFMIVPSDYTWICTTSAIFAARRQLGGGRSWQQL